MTSTKLDVDALVAALDSRRKAEELSWRELARQAKVSPSTLTRMQQGKRPDVDTFGALVKWLGAPADDFLVGSQRVERRAHPVTAVSALLRGKKELSPQAAEALDDLVQAAFKLFKEMK